MKRRLLQCVTVIATTLGVCSTLAWILAGKIKADVAWTVGTTHYQIVSYDGAVWLIQHFDWWRQEKVSIRIDTDPGDAPIETWPGMRVESKREAIGVAIITGKWVSPFIEVRPDTEFTSPDVSIQPGTMYSATTPVLIVSVKYWLVASLSALWLIAQTARVRHSRKVPEETNSELAECL